jgi:hypothetical protein
MAANPVPASTAGQLNAIGQDRAYSRAIAYSCVIRRLDFVHVFAGTAQGPEKRFGPDDCCNAKNASRNLLRLLSSS